ncbi:941_t:CDS:1 [Ambispora leptoticha]|uniref:941_t:CDS:1 n=1 Tax=Ambispora leptoticha TaxID=144679 RepID=A0A9N8VMN0_9GLOM|nr:941_t:CDS:1 [Ambispora leptoticha]
MKTIIIPLIELKTSCLKCFQSCHAFDAEWCLDLHGFLSRDEFAARLNEINNHIKDIPLLSERTMNIFKNICSVIGSHAILFIIVSFFLSPTHTISFIGPVVVLSTIFIYILGTYLIDRTAKHRAEKFTASLNSLFTHYNIRQKDNPTANWNLVWRRANLSHYTIKMKASWDGSVKGKATPKYVEYAEIVLEINDALSELTAQTVRVNLAADVISYNLSLSQDAQEKVVSNSV